MWNLPEDMYKIWLEDMYKEAKADHLAIANHEHLCALGSPDNETATIHEQSAERHREFAKMMDDLISELYTK